MVEAQPAWIHNYTNPKDGEITTVGGKNKVNISPVCGDEFQQFRGEHHQFGLTSNKLNRIAPSAFSIEEVSKTNG